MPSTKEIEKTIIEITQLDDLNEQRLYKLVTQNKKFTLYKTGLGNSFATNINKDTEFGNLLRLAFEVQPENKSLRIKDPTALLALAKVYEKGMNPEVNNDSKGIKKNLRKACFCASLAYKLNANDALMVLRSMIDPLKHNKIHELINNLEHPDKPMLASIDSFDKEHTLDNHNDSVYAVLTNFKLKHQLDNKDFQKIVIKHQEAVDKLTCLRATNGAIRYYLTINQQSEFSIYCHQLISDIQTTIAEYNTACKFELDVTSPSPVAKLDDLLSRIEQFRKVVLNTKFQEIMRILEEMEKNSTNPMNLKTAKRVLKLESHALQNEKIERSYKNLSRMIHPDKVRNLNIDKQFAHEAFQYLNQARTVCTEAVTILQLANIQFRLEIGTLQTQYDQLASQCAFVNETEATQFTIALSEIEQAISQVLEQAKIAFKHQLPNIASYQLAHLGSIHQDLLSMKNNATYRLECFNEAKQQFNLLVERFEEQANSYLKLPHKKNKNRLLMIDETRETIQELIDDESLHYPEKGRRLVKHLWQQQRLIKKSATCRSLSVLLQGKFFNTSQLATAYQVVADSSPANDCFLSPRKRLGI